MNRKPGVVKNQCLQQFSKIASFRMGQGVFVILILLLVCSVQPALAWGPVTHGAHLMYFAEHVAEPYRTIILENPNEFMYGSVAPDLAYLHQYEAVVDIVNFRVWDVFEENGRYKQLHKEPSHWMHDWRIGVVMMNRAANDMETSFALGYLSHIAADAVQSQVFSEGMLQELGAPELITEAFAEIHQPQADVGELRKAYRLADPSVSCLLFEVLTDKNTPWGIEMEWDDFNSYLSDWYRLMDSESTALTIKNSTVLAPFRWVEGVVYRNFIAAHVDDKWDAIFDPSTYENLPEYYDEAGKLLAASINDPVYGDYGTISYWEVVSRNQEMKPFDFERHRAWEDSIEITLSGYGAYERNYVLLAWHAFDRFVVANGIIMLLCTAYLFTRWLRNWIAGIAKPGAGVIPGPEEPLVDSLAVGSSRMASQSGNNQRDTCLICVGAECQSGNGSCECGNNR